MSDLREMFSARVQPVVKLMLAAEAKSRGLKSEGQLIDDLVLAHCRSNESVKILLTYAQRHPIVTALREIEDSALNDKPSPSDAEARVKRGSKR